MTLENAASMLNTSDSSPNIGLTDASHCFKNTGSDGIRTAPLASTEYFGTALAPLAASTTTAITGLAAALKKPLAGGKLGKYVRDEWYLAHSGFDI